MIRTLARQVDLEYEEQGVARCSGCDVRDLFGEDVSKCCGSKGLAQQRPSDWNIRIWCKNIGPGCSKAPTLRFYFCHRHTTCICLYLEQDEIIKKGAKGETSKLIPSKTATASQRQDYTRYSFTSNT